MYSETQSPPKSPQSPRSEKERSPPESSSEESNPEIHEGAVCDHCDMQPILGPRFKCASCDDVSLCKKCYKRRQEIHRPSHRFFAMKPMKSDQPIQPIQPHSPRPLAERADSGEPQELLAAGRAPRAEQYPEAPTPNTNVAPVSVSAPMIVPAVAQEVASQMQERFLNMGKGYATLAIKSGVNFFGPVCNMSASRPCGEFGKPGKLIPEEKLAGRTCSSLDTVFMVLAISVVKVCDLAGVPSCAGRPCSKEAYKGAWQSLKGHANAIVPTHTQRQKQTEKSRSQCSRQQR